MSHSSQSIAAALSALDGWPLLQGPRVRLRGPRDADVEAFFELFGDPRVMRYWSRPPLTERAEAEQLLTRCHDEFAARTALEWIIADENDRAIGSCKLFRLNPTHRRAELGYALHPDHWGRGVAREANTLALDWAFGTLGLHRVDAGIDPDNTASRALLHRLGFVTEGRQRESFFVEDRVTDSELLGLLGSDWRRDR
ncbi:GNAT family N-acetyltransferase [Pseudomonas sp. CGJS7]|uniref:GNAT family N-acetyltransferase n=1 Tax=Pseudomonas sp. CGJS7 TaxID=3109348 RepID=UPI00300BBE8E